MKTGLLSTLALVATLATGCDDKGGKTAGKDTSSGKLPPGVDTLVEKGRGAVDRAKALSDTKGKALTPAQYEKLLLALAECKVTDDGIDYKCDAYKKIQKARNAKTTLKDMAGAMSGLGKKHLGHKHPAVRIRAAQMMSSFLGSSEETRKIILATIAKEKHPAVVAALMEVVGSSGSKDPAVGKMLLAKADDPSPVVRRKAIGWLTSSWSKKVAGRIAKLKEKMEKDPDPKTQQAACSQAGKTGDDQLIPAYTKLTKDDKNPDLYSACMKGLLEMFASYPFFETHSEKAYKLFLKRLGDKPRSEKRPPWSIMSSVGHLGDKRDKLKKWRANAPWFKAADVIKALEAVVKDEKANWMARTGAVKSILALGAKKAQLEALEKACKDCNNHVKKSLKDAVGKAK